MEEREFISDESGFLEYLEPADQIPLAALQIDHLLLHMGGDVRATLSAVCTVTSGKTRCSAKTRVTPLDPASHTRKVYHLSISQA